MTERGEPARHNQAPRIDARETIDRFISLGGLTGSTESSLEKTAGRPLTESNVEDLSKRIAAAASADPWAFRVLGKDRHEKVISSQLRSALVAIHENGRHAELSLSERGVLEAIVLLDGRPSLFIKNDTFANPDGSWSVLAPYKPDISTVIKSVGRLAIPSHGIPYVGTGFVVGRDLIMTNRHVLYPYFVSKSAGNSEKSRDWHFNSGVRMTIDFKQEFGNSDKSEFEIKDVALIYEDDSIDLALLRLNTSGDALHALPPPLRVQSSTNYVAKDNMVYVIGYPGADTERNDPTEMHRIFGAVYEKKRLAPGRVTFVNNTERSLSHDCSTLAGSSGSCVIDLSTNSVIGLHFEGTYLKTNTAVLLPALAEDTFLRALNFKEGRDGL